MEEQTAPLPDGELTAELGTKAPSRRLLADTFDRWVVELFGVFSVTDRLLRDYRGAKGVARALPTPVEGIAECCGFEIVPEDLNRYRSKQISLTIGQISLPERKIFTDNGIGVSYAQKRYAVAHELGHAYLQDQLQQGTQHCTEARIPSGRNEFLADIFAAFLMLPPRETFEYVREYIQSDPKRPVDHEKMMEELSGAARYPYTRTITAYEYLRLLASYEHYHKEEIIRLMKSLGEESVPIADLTAMLEEPIASVELYG